MSTNAVLFCSPSRFRGSPCDGAKHMLEVEGERLMDRVRRQCGERAVAVEVFSAETRWFAESLVTALQHSGEPQTLALFGDVWYDDADLDAILAAPVKDFAAYGRYYPSRLTGGPSELFAMRWTREAVPTVVDAAADVVRICEQRDADCTAGLDNVCDITGSPWWVYRHLIGATVDEHEIHADRWGEVKRWTEDFDSDDDLLRWTRNRADRFLQL